MKVADTSSKKSEDLEAAEIFSSIRTTLKKCWSEVNSER